MNDPLMNNPLMNNPKKLSTPCASTPDPASRKPFEAPRLRREPDLFGATGALYRTFSS